MSQEVMSHLEVPTLWRIEREILYMIISTLSMQLLQKGAFFGDTLHLYQMEGITFSITDYQPQDFLANSKHYHEHPNISFILSAGSIERKAHQENEKLPGALMYYYAGEAHQNIRKVFTARSLNLEIEFCFLQHFQICGATMEKALHANSDAKFLILKLNKELLEKNSFTLLNIQLLLLDIINQTQKLESQKGWPEWLSKVYELIHDRWYETISLSELSTTAQVHPITISKQFPRFFNCRVGEYMRRLKVEKTLQLIRTTRKSLTQIAFDCGFADQSHFIRKFKGLTSFSPLQYKKL